LADTGKVFLIGAGPGDPELLTLKAAKALRSADVVLHDELVSDEILGLIPPQANLVNVGKRAGQKSASQAEINRVLAEYALLGLQVVRLKGGDPFIFGRGGEELEALRQLGIAVEVVPGITAALGAAAGLQIPLTHREVSSTLVLVTGSSKNSDHVANWPNELPSNATVVIYMPGNDLAVLQQRLFDSKVKPETPIAIISNATTESENAHITTVADLHKAPSLAAPKLLVVGEVVRFVATSGLREYVSAFDLNEISSVSSSIAEKAK
jgi:uroporphyrin-III C-methyltransferase